MSLLQKSNSRKIDALPTMNEGKRRLYLVIVVMTMEEGLLPEDHARQHATQAPHIQTVVIHLKHKTSVSGTVNRF